MNTSSESPAASLPLPSEEQVKAFIAAKCSEIMAARGFDRLYLSAFVSNWKDYPNNIVQFTISPGGLPNFMGRSIEEALAKYDEEHSPEALRARAQKLREEAAALEAKIERFPITDETKVTIVEQASTLTWRELVAANADGSSSEEIEAWRRELAQRGEAKVGGGAAAAFTLKLAA